jgi:hypothetical protein
MVVQHFDEHNVGGSAELGALITKILVWNGTDYDSTRWICFVNRSPGFCHVLLADACSPGKVSSLESVMVPVRYLTSALRHGTLQVTLETGYFLIHGDESVARIEFRGKDDASTTRAIFLSSDIESVLDKGGNTVAMSV